MNFISHRKANGVERLLEEHLIGVAEKSGGFAESFGSKDWAYVAGLWHDLGKYNPEFQDYIRAVTENQEDAHLEAITENAKIKNGGGMRRVDHSSAGAIHAMKRYEAINDGITGRILAYLIAGHHAGLNNWNNLTNRLGNKKHLDKVLKVNPSSDILDYNLPDSIAISNHNLPLAASMWIRMLFSCLVDADFLDTEEFMNNKQSSLRENKVSMNSLQTEFDLFMKKKFENCEGSPVNIARRDILRQCRDKAGKISGYYSLTVPTGGGKTLASLAFAINHAISNNKERIIYVIPYTSIIEQTAEIFREVFKNIPNAVVEHHSNFDETQLSYDLCSRQRLAAENWDAPIIVTTNVQFFESLFAVRTSRVRKLHNICNSVVIMDEAQLMPHEYLDPICAAMNELRYNYGVSFVLSTATQPALMERKNFLGLKGQVVEIVDNHQQLKNSLSRTTIELPSGGIKSSWQDIATRLAEYDKVLCVVNSRKDCRELVSLLPDETIHLSALMCPEHRSKVIADIKLTLASSSEVSLRVISTQLVEAGVDLDFPVVFRAMAGLDSIIQTAGRCNREGKFGENGGKVVVFNPPNEPHSGMMKKAFQVANELILLHGNRIFDEKDIFNKYFFRFYNSTNSHDRHEILKYLRYNDNLEFQFKEACEKFKLIDDEGYSSVIVRYGKGSDYIEQLLNGLKPERWLWRKLQRFTVNITKSEHEKLLKVQEIKEVVPGLFVQMRQELYDEKLGFCAEKCVTYSSGLLVT